MLIKNCKYQELLKKVSIKSNELKNKSILLSGATGLIGSLLIDLIMYNNINNDLNCKIIGLGRNEKKANQRFQSYIDSKFFVFYKCDVCDKVKLNEINDDVDFIIHAASNTHPVAYSTDPIGTINTNVIGLDNMLNLAEKKKIQKFVFVSSVEIYGQNLTKDVKMNEVFSGYIDCNTLRAGYPESKRLGESLCQAYYKQKNVPCVIVRLPRVFGPTMLLSDSKASSQFLINGLNNENIVLKSEGSQFYSYLHVADAVGGLLHVLINGNCPEAYNLASDELNITLKELANIIANYCNVKVIFDLPNETEKLGFSKATTAILDSSKAYNLGWKPVLNLKESIAITIELLRDISSYI